MKYVIKAALIATAAMLAQPAFAADVHQYDATTTDKGEYKAAKNGMLEVPDHYNRPSGDAKFMGIPTETGNDLKDDRDAQRNVRPTH